MYGGAMNVRLIMYVVIFMAVIATLGAIVHGIDQRGYKRADDKWKAKEAAAIIAAEKKRAIDQAELNGVGLAFAENTQKERIVERKIYETIEIYVPATDPMLSGGFRMQHDAAATGVPLDRFGRIDAAPVASQDVAKTVSDNYAECRRDKLKIIDLQTTVRVLNGGKRDSARANPGTAAPDGAAKERPVEASVGYQIF